MTLTNNVKVKKRPIRKTPYEWYVDEAKRLNTGRILSKDEYSALHKKDVRKLTPYERYVIRATELNVEIFTKGEYEGSIELNEKKGRKVNDWILPRWQFQGDNTDKQIDAMWNAAKLQNPGITRDQFIRDRGWETIDKQAEDLYEQIKSTEEYKRLDAEIEKLENKARDEDLDLWESRRLNKLKNDKAAMLHQISQQIYGSE